MLYTVGIHTTRPVYLVDAQDGRIITVTQPVESASQGLHVAGSLCRLVRLKLAAEQCGHRVDHHQPHQASGEQDGHPLRHTDLQRPLAGTQHDTAESTHLFGTFTLEHRI